MTDPGEATSPDENVRPAPEPGGRPAADSAVQPAGGVLQPAETAELSVPPRGFDPGRVPPGGTGVTPPQVLEGRIVEPYVRGQLPAPVPAPRSRLTPVLLSTIVVLLLVVAALLVIIITKPTGTTNASGSASPSGRTTPTAPGRQSPTEQQTPSQTPATSTPPSSGPSAGSGAPTDAAGPPSTLLGSYEINLSLDYSVPLGPNKPAQGDFNQGNQGDLRLNNFAGSITLMPLGGLKMVTLNQGTKPTYDLCKSDTLFAGSEPPTARTSFCMFGGGTMIGVYVASVANTNAIANVDHVVLDVTVWQD